MAAHDPGSRSSISRRGTSSGTTLVQAALESTEHAAAARFWPMLLLVALCQTADLITFNFAVETFGPSGELGPLGLVYRIGGFWAVALVKMGLIAIVMLVLARYPWQRLATRRRMSLIVAGIGLFGALTNLLAFVWLT